MTSLRVLSYNIAGQRGDMAAMTALVRELAPDIVLVQEGPRRLRWRGRSAQLAQRWGLFYVVGGEPAVGNLVLAGVRVQPLSTWHVRFPLTPGRHMRGAALARCRIGDAVVVVASSHLGTDAAERPGQADLLAKELAEATDPVILGADLNETDGGAAWRMLADGRIDVGAGTGPTYPAHQPRVRIDAVFVDPQIKVREAHLVDTAHARRASDHLPIMADLVLPSRNH